MKEYERHGKRNTPEYQIWADMVKRCTNHKRSQFSDYGGRGILVCEKWRRSFDSFYDDMGERPEGATIERKDVNCGYSPENCYWELDRGVQSFNTRVRKDNVSGKAGVMWDSQRGKWQAFIHKDKKKIFLGRFDNIEDAILARKQGELKYYGRLKDA